MALGPGSSELTPSMLNPPHMPARIETVRQQFERRAAKFAQHDFVVREIERRLLERLELVRISPQHVLDLGCGAGTSLSLIRSRYRQAHWLGLDLSLAMLNSAPLPTFYQRWLQGWQPLQARVCGQATQLPVADQSIDLLFSNLMLHWHPTPHQVFPEMQRVLKNDGLLMFSCFGPDSLRELRAAFSVAWPQARPLSFVDMHDFGDMMVSARLATPVMDTEVITLTYANPQQLLAEVGALGGNPRDDRAIALPTSRQVRSLLDTLRATSDDAGRIRLTLEVIYGHAWKLAQKTALIKGESRIPLNNLQEQLRQKRF